MDDKKLVPYLSPAAAFALSTGTAIGWGSFVVTGNLYLAQAGPLGSVLGMLVGMVIMLLIARNYHYMMNRYPGPGGAYTYMANTFGYDNAFLNAWLLLLAYVAMFWANATSLPLFARYFIGDFFRIGHIYSLLGTEVYLGEGLFSAFAILLAGILCMKKGRLAAKVMVALVALFIGAIVFCFLAAMLKRDAGLHDFSPLMMPDQSMALQVLRIALISPWAFIGFENISHSSGEFSFPRNRSFRVMATAIVVTTILYICVILLSVTVWPSEFRAWPAYISNLGSMKGLDALPPFYAGNYYLGDVGVVLLALALLSLIVTSLIGNLVAISRLIYELAKEEVLFDRFAVLNIRCTPENALHLIVMLSLLIIPFLGRIAIGWIVDVNTVVAVIVYGFISAAAYRCAGKNGDRVERVTGMAGMALMVGFGIVELFPAVFNTGTMATESYFLFMLWAILGIIFFRNVLVRDAARKFGKSIVVWIGFSALIFFMAQSWLHRANQDYTNTVVSNIYSYHNGTAPSSAYQYGEEEFIAKQMEGLKDYDTKRSSLVIALFLFSLWMIINNYSVVARRNRETEQELGATKELAGRDPLTGVKSKLAFTERENEMDAAIEEGRADHFAVVVCDLNGVKRINDTKGHKAGDEYIRSASVLICNSFKRSPVFRIGGDEFVVILKGYDYEQRTAILEALDRQVEENIRTKQVIISTGMADYRPGQDRKLKAVFERADVLMYKRKRKLKEMGAVSRE
ncbi:MAG: amino acid permease [Acidaminococcaceae bacterium]|nr:amino acid permease [Acidaminococcaceae bacterium]